MSDVFAKNAAEVALVEHDQPVERLVADGSNHALAVGVRPRSPAGSEATFRGLATENLIAVVDTSTPGLSTTASSPEHLAVSQPRTRRQSPTP
jgi:hypothetical protein